MGSRVTLGEGVQGVRVVHLPSLVRSQRPGHIDNIYILFNRVLAGRRKRTLGVRGVHLFVHLLAAA